MKKLLLSLMALGALAAAPACSDKEDDGNETKNTVTITETDSQIQLKHVISGLGLTITSNYTWNFNEDGLCVSANTVYTYPSGTMAKRVYEEMVEDVDIPAEEKALYSISGKVINYDMTDIYAGFSKKKVRELAEDLKKLLEGGDDVVLVDGEAA